MAKSSQTFTVQILRRNLEHFLERADAAGVPRVPITPVEPYRGEAVVEMCFADSTTDGFGELVTGVMTNSRVWGVAGMRITVNNHDVERGTPGLDLQLESAWAKWTGAGRILNQLQDDIPRYAMARARRSLKEKFNRDTGWYTLHASLVPEVGDLALGVLLGEFAHNLRSALDYTVTALVDASPKAVLTRSHQFPIVIQASRWREVRQSQLRGVAHAVELIRGWQPFNLQDDAPYAPLALLGRLSNTDKHRALAVHSVELTRADVRVTYDGGEVIEDLRAEPVAPAGSPVRLVGLRFIEPPTTKPVSTITVDYSGTFSIPPFPPDFPDPLVLDLERLELLREHVRMILDQLDRL